MVAIWLPLRDGTRPSQVFASIEVPPVRQTLFLRGAKLNGASTLHAANVKAGDTLHLKVHRGHAVRSNGSRVVWSDFRDFNS